MRSMTSLLRLGALAGLAAAIPACYDHGYGNYNQPYNIAWFVDPALGNDFTGDGSPQFPFQSITHALQYTISGDEIVLAQGTYSAGTNNEVFPILVKPGVLILGDPANSGVTTIIEGGGSYTVQGGTQIGQGVTAAFVLSNGVEISGVKVTSAAGVGIVCDGSSGVILTSSTITGCGASGLRTFQGASLTVTSTTITANTGTGVTTFDTSSPVFRSCTITSNLADGVLAENTSVPDLGNSAAAGSNTLTGNTGVGLHNDTTASTIQAVGNTWIVSTQGADLSGHYAPALTPGVVGAVNGNNFAITQALAAIQF